MTAPSPQTKEQTMADRFLRRIAVLEMTLSETVVALDAVADERRTPIHWLRLLAKKRASEITRVLNAGMS